MYIYTFIFIHLYLYIYKNLFESIKVIKYYKNLVKKQNKY